MTAVKSARIEDLGLKAGDVLLFINYKHVFIQSIWYSGVFSHSAIIINDSELAESFLGDQVLYPGRKSVNGINVSPIKERLAAYNGTIYVSRLSREISDQQMGRLRAYASDKKIRYPEVSASVLDSLTLSNRDDRHCFQFIASAIDKISDIGLSKYDTRAVCDRISRLPGTRLEPGLKYTDLIRVSLSP